MTVLARIGEWASIFALPRIGFRFDRVSQRRTRRVAAMPWLQPYCAPVRCASCEHWRIIAISRARCDFGSAPWWISRGVAARFAADGKS